MKHNDGIIKFHEQRCVKGLCGHCGEQTIVWGVKEVTLPDGIEPSHRLILFSQSPSPPGYKPLKQIGIGCGCYAKFHRQVAHIQDRLKKR